MIRVLQVFGKLTRGGLETFVMNLYRAIDKSQVQFDFLVSAAGGDYEQEAKAMGARIFRLPSRHEGLRKYNRALDTFFREHAHEFAAVHQHASSLSSIEPLKFATKYKIPLRIIHAHSSSISKSVKANLLHRAMHLWGKMHIAHYATNYLGCSDKALDWIFNGSGVRDKAEMVNNGINVPKYRFDERKRAEVRKELNLGTNYVLGHVGNFIPVKNHMFLLKIFKEFKKTHQHSKLVLVGDGPLKEDIRKQIQDLNLNDDVILTGVRNDVNRLLQAIDVIVMPSIFEGLPVSLVEAQTAGLPLVISHTISHDVALTPNVKFVSLNDDTANWASAINDFSNHFRRVDCSDIIDEKGFGIDGIARKFTQLYISE